MGRTRKNQRTKQKHWITFTATDELYRKICKQADSEDRNLSNFVYVTMREAMKVRGKS